MPFGVPDKDHKRLERKRTSERRKKPFRAAIFTNYEMPFCDFSRVIF
jgi:hypothetical protein